jgi:hypothetical protein
VLAARSWCSAMCGGFCGDANMFEPDSNLPNEETFRFVECPDSVGGNGEEYGDGEGEGGSCAKS